MFEEINFGRIGELDALVRAHVAAPWLRQRRDAMRLYGPTDWPFTGTNVTR